MQESKIQSDSIEYALTQGCIGGKTDMAGRRGWPDCLFILPSGHTWFVEFKQLGAKLRPEQIRTINKIRKNNADISVIDSIPEFRLALDNRLERFPAGDDHRPI